MQIKIYFSGGMNGLQTMMRQLQQGAAGGLSNLMGGFGGQSWEKSSYNKNSVTEFSTFSWIIRQEE